MRSALLQLQRVGGKWDVQR
ncbi:hypothetical protein Goari_010474 [Gossypium aridum]|uniref:Uncharacterized protein n=1 Tax=Gossypium aridum TaxID=34290 RepID=A0A7J8Y1P9_GOSAI|nr:hypothetical protein [Gossypium aridum]